MHYRIKSVLALLLIILSVGICSQTVNAAEQNKVYTSEHIKDEEARNLYQRLLDATKDFVNEEIDSEYIGIYSIDYDYYKRTFNETVNLSEEEFEKYTAYEIFLEDITYVEYQHELLNHASSRYLKSEQATSVYLEAVKFISDYIINSYNDGTNPIILEVVEEIGKYQYRYLQTNGCFYDFFRGADYMELQGMVQKKDEISKEEPAVETKQEVQENEDIEIDEVKTEVSEEKSEKESNPLAPKNVFSDLIRDHIVSIIIIAILVVLLAYITIKNKIANKKDID